MTKKPKIKTFVITVSKKFLAKHPFVGKPTGFKKKILTGEKIHTIRGNRKYWKGIVDKVNSNEAVLSVRQWKGLPYRSEQVEIARFKKLGYQKVAFAKNCGMTIDKKKLFDRRQWTRVAKNDGLTLEQFNDWFPTYFEGCIIHFTDFKY